MALGSLHEIVVACPNPAALARFWQAVVGGEVDVDGDWAALDGDDVGVSLVFVAGTARAGGPVLCVDVDDLAAATDEAEQLGARKIGPVVDDDDDGSYQAMADPAGHSFRLVSD